MGGGDQLFGCRPFRPFESCLKRVAGLKCLAARLEIPVPILELAFPNRRCPARRHRYTPSVGGRNLAGGGAWRYALAQYRVSQGDDEDAKETCPPPQAQNA